MIIFVGHKKARDSKHVREYFAKINLQPQDLTFYHNKWSRDTLFDQLILFFYVSFGQILAKKIHLFEKSH